MFSPTIRKSDIPETMWLPKDIRMRLEGEVNGYPIPSKSDILMMNSVIGTSDGISREDHQLQHLLSSLIDRIGYLESLLNRMDIESRISRLETQPFVGCFSPSNSADTYMPISRRGA
jgi:hypothetical protein